MTLATAEKKPSKLLLLKISGFLILASFLGGISVWYYKKIYFPKKLAYEWQELARTEEIFRRGIDKIAQLWQQGDQDGLWSTGKLVCPELLGTYGNSDASVVRCNPRYLECYFSKQGPLKIELNRQTYNIYLAQEFATTENMPRVYQVANRSLKIGIGSHPFAFPSGVRVRMKIKELPEFHRDLFLQSTCNEAFLPQRKYSYGSADLSAQKKTNFEWDNFGRYIVFDRFLVTVGDLIDWADAIKLPENLQKKIRTSGKPPYYPAVNLLPQEMKEYCRFHGKNILDALTFDAASFYPLKLNEVLPKNISRGPYPWTYRERDSFVTKIIQGDKSELTVDNCQKLFAKECLEIATFKSHGHESNSFAGLFQVLGGVMEYVDNPLDPELNLKASSFYLEFDSPYHRLGKRAYWDGEGFRREHFTKGRPSDSREKKEQLDLPLDVSNFEVGFRCMRESFDAISMTGPNGGAQ